MPVGMDKPMTIKRPKGRADGSWWASAPREGFTALAFSQKDRMNPRGSPEPRGGVVDNRPATFSTRS